MRRVDVGREADPGIDNSEAMIPDAVRPSLNRDHPVPVTPDLLRYY